MLLDLGISMDIFLLASFPLVQMIYVTFRSIFIRFLSFPASMSVDYLIIINEHNKNNVCSHAFIIVTTFPWTLRLTLMEDNTGTGQRTLSFTLSQRSTSPCPNCAQHIVGLQRIFVGRQIELIICEMSGLEQMNFLSGLPWDSSEAGPEMRFVCKQYKEGLLRRQNRGRKKPGRGGTQGRTLAFTRSHGEALRSKLYLRIYIFLREGSWGVYIPVPVTLWPKTTLRGPGTFSSQQSGQSGSSSSKDGLRKDSAGCESKNIEAKGKERKWSKTSEANQVEPQQH